MSTNGLEGGHDRIIQLTTHCSNNTGMNTNENKLTMIVILLIAALMWIVLPNLPFREAQPRTTTRSRSITVGVVSEKPAVILHTVSNSAVAAAETGQED